MNQDDLRAELVEWTRLLERQLVYEIKKDKNSGDDEGARLKSFMLAQVRETLSHVIA